MKKGAAGEQHCRVSTMFARQSGRQHQHAEVVQLTSDHSVSPSNPVITT